MGVKNIILTEIGTVPRHLRAMHGKMVKRALMETLAEHHRDFMPGHFTKEGARKHKYKPRRGEEPGLSRKQFFRSYTGRKQREKGHTLPLVWSGASRVLAQVRDVRGNTKRARLVQHARGLNRRNKHSDINMAREISDVSPDQAQVARDRFGRKYLDGMRRINLTTRTKIEMRNVS